MSKPTFGTGVLIALLLSLAAAAISAALTPLFSAYAVIRAAISLATLVYVLLLLSASGIRFGRATTCAAALSVMALAFYLAPPLALFTLLHIGLIWLARCFYYHSGVLAAVADLGLCLLGFAAAAWALQQSGSTLLAFWCFFLIQAAILPALRSRHRTPPLVDSGSTTPDHHERFQRAYRSAEDALRKASLTT